MEEREIIYLSLHCHHQNDSCIKMGSDESHFNVSVGSDGQNHKTVSTNHNLFEEKGEPKRYRTEARPPLSLVPYKPSSSSSSNVASRSKRPYELLLAGVGGGGGGGCPGFPSRLSHLKYTVCVFCGPNSQSDDLGVRF